MKKAQGLSLNVVIVAAIVLIVLIVLWAIFTGRMGAFSQGATQTQRCNDVCVAAGRIAGTAQDLECTNPATDVGKYSDPSGKLMQHCCCDI
ncbi:MAG: hypothetical protein ABIJ08_00540 [Nanoarchaeota archaeon]